MILTIILSTIIIIETLAIVKFYFNESSYLKIESRFNSSRLRPYWIEHFSSCWLMEKWRVTETKRDPQNGVVAVCFEFGCGGKQIMYSGDEKYNKMKEEVEKLKSWQPAGTVSKKIFKMKQAKSEFLINMEMEKENDRKRERKLEKENR